MSANIDLFNTYCVAILGALYASFPVPTVVKAEDAAELVGLDRFDQSARTIYAETVIFLRDEGYLTFGGEAGSGGPSRVFMGVRLTSKGLAALNRTPKELDDAPSIGERIAGWTGSLLKDASRDVIKTAIQTVLSA